MMLNVHIYSFPEKYEIYLDQDVDFGRQNLMKRI